MADLTYTVSVDTDSAQRNLQRLQSTLGQLNDTFVRLGTVIGTVLGAALTTGVANAIAYADRINDLSDATGVAIENIVGFGQAVQDAGGSAEGAEKALLRFVNSIGDAAAGSRETQDAFAQVGVSLKDLATLSEQDLLKKTIDGLATVGDTATASRLKTQLLGKEFRGVSAQGLAQGYGSAVTGAKDYADAIRTAAQTQAQLDRLFNNFRLNLLDGIRPILDLANNINVSTEAFKQFFAAIAGAAILVLSVTAIGRAFTLVRLAITGLVSIWGSLVAGFSQFITIAGNFITNFGLIIQNIRSAGTIFSGIRAAIIAVGLAIADVLTPVFAAISTYATPIVIALGAAWGYVEGSVSAVIGRVRSLLEYLGLVDPSVDVPQPEKPDVEGERTRREIINKAAQDMAKFRLEQQLAAQATSRDLVERTARLDLDNKLFYKNGQLTNISEDQVEIERLKIRLLDEQASKTNALRDQIDKLKLDQQLGLDPNAGAKIDVLQKAIKNLNGAYREFIPNQVELTQQTQDIRRLEEDRKRTIDNLNKSIDDYIARNQTLGDSLKSINDQQKDLQFNRGLIGRGQLEKDIANIKENARKAALEAGRAYAQAFEDTGDGLTTERAQELSDGLNRITQGYKGIANAQIENLLASRDWESGWSEAFANYADSAANAADQARTYFDSFTRGFENLFSDLVTKGKANWRDFVTSIIAEFARIEAKRMLVNLFGGGLTSGGGLLGNLLGSVMPAQFGSPAQQLVAGLRPMATGGLVMKPTAALVGEAGPEAVIPLNEMSNIGGGTQVTYNINAVDAASFRALVARDPGFIHAVAETGRRSQPTRRG
jgi:lambda family phage tail tape measure protein